MSTAARQSPRLLRLDRAFVILALVFGTAQVIVNPPFQTADEAQHFFRAYQITQGEFISREKTTLGQAGGYLPFSLYDLWMHFFDYVIHPERPIPPGHVLQSLKIPLEPQKKALIEFGNTAHYFPACYFPQCVGVCIGRVLALPPAFILYLGRETNLLVFTLLGFFSLRLAPALARPLFLLLLIPTLLCLAASVSADTSTDALAIFFTALVCHYFSAPPNCIRRGAFFLILLITIPLSVGKLVYTPLLALLLLIPARSFGGAGRKAGMLLLLFAINLTVLVAWTVATSDIDTKITTQANVSPPEQLSRLEQHPFHFLPLLWHTATDGGWFVCTTYVAVIGWMDLNFPPPVVIAYFLMLIFFCWTAGDRPPLPSPVRCALIIIPGVIVSCVAIALLNFLYWTPLGSRYILGLQGRYFFPLAPAIFLLACAIAQRIPRSSSSPRRENVLNAGVILISVVMSSCLLLLVWRRFYG